MSYRQQPTPPARRQQDRAESIAEQGYTDVTYVATAEEGRPLDDLGPAACLNRALGRLYPRNDVLVPGAPRTPTANSHP